MSTKVTKLEINVPNPEVITGIEKLLVMAKSGELQSYVLVGELTGARVVDSYAGTSSDVYSMAGHLLSAAVDYKHRNIEWVD